MAMAARQKPDAGGMIVAGAAKGNGADGQDSPLVKIAASDLKSAREQIKKLLDSATSVSAAKAALGRSAPPEQFASDALVRLYVLQLRERAGDATDLEAEWCRLVADCP